MGIDLYDFSYLLTPGKLNSFGSQVILENRKYKEEYVNTLKLVKEAIKNHKLRDLVRIYANSYPPLKSLLRQIDRNLPCNQGTPLFGVKTLYCTDHTDFSRPEVNRFRKRVKETFLIKPYVQGILFLPCSAKKPYSQSKSHQFFLSTIRRTIKGRRSYLQEIILTSPLGIVPRELEYTFPAAHYDIPVTGDWSKLEQDILYQDVKNLLEKINDSITIIGFVKGVERNVLERISEDSGREIHLPNPETDCLLSRDGKNALFRLLSKNCLFSSSIKINSNLEFIRTIADYQFGKGAGKLIFPSNTQIVGRKELGFRIRLNKEHLSSFRPSSGFLTLSIEAAKRIQHHSKRKVIFDGKKIVGSTIFTNAIQHADLDIRINDEVFVENDQGKIIATGTSYLPGKLLTDMNRGYGVKIRQKVRGE
jgi:archaeosine synthase